MIATKVKALIMLSITCLVIFWLDYKITHYDLSYYSGKDNGLGSRLISICLLSSVFYYAFGGGKIVLTVLGFFMGLLASIISYFVWISCFDDYGLSFHVLACAIAVLFFLLLKRFFPSLSGTKI